MDDGAAESKARAFLAELADLSAPVPLERYVSHVNGVLKYVDDMEPDEPGSSFVRKEKLYIMVNDKDIEERQRFTVCHEIAHHVLKLESQHQGPAWSYTKRPPNEVACDVFAAELMLPWKLFKPHVDKADLGFSAIDELASLFKASVTSTGSRFAVMNKIPCAFVLIEQNRVRHASRSVSLRGSGAWIQPGSSVSADTPAGRVRAQGSGTIGPEEVDPDLWFSDWTSGGSLWEESRFLPKWDQTLTLLWGEEEEIQERRPHRESTDVGGGEYRALDGNLPWPSGKRRR